MMPKCLVFLHKMEFAPVLAHSQGGLLISATPACEKGVWSAGWLSVMNTPLGGPLPHSPSAALSYETQLQHLLHHYYCFKLSPSFFPTD